MFGQSDSSDRRKAWWRNVLDSVRSMTGMLPILGFNQPKEPPVEPVHRDDTVEGGAPSGEMHDQQHVNPAPHLESGHPKR
ncbi:MAG: hypothetical protein R3C39_08240 [Dehalococcoidia bacterium]